MLMLKYLHFNQDTRRRTLRCSRARPRQGTCALTGVWASSLLMMTGQESRCRPHWDHFRRLRNLGYCDPLLFLLPVIVLFGCQPRTDCERDAPQICEVVRAVHQYQEVRGTLPQSLHDVLDCTIDGHHILERIPLDSFGSELQYARSAPAPFEFRVYSLGADRKPGGLGEDADMDNIILAIK